MSRGCRRSLSQVYIKKKKRKKSSVPPAALYRIICSSVDRLFVSSTTLSHLIFASRLHLVMPLLFAFAINFLFDILYIIKLSYYRVRIRLSLKSSIHLFICLTSFNAASYPRSRFLLSFPLFAPYSPSSSHTYSLSLFLSFHRLRFCFFYFIQTRMFLSSMALRGVSQGYKSPVHAITK